MEMFLNAYVPNEIRKVIGLIENNLDSRIFCLQNIKWIPVVSGLARAGARSGPETG
ncbi:hypothetical protein [Pseudomonas gingeri]|uniref:Uncharacterized protein n=1 Tax=Pseudomonas gingeri TaxID=117681 RepID=A0A7Y7Y714_9PSED|nr:hypothetical protein [Pseudomonas gingeri]NWB29953.1 hypothetical protein [Pseudomonas gingeri]NWC30852.1 hypothetical protein [Pseudomonas gingeri]NWD09494.1 hypothetical protein [Pseudomonas gingeri]NWD49850.1 hypothetical protein [Pseudomonas gingeri]NWE34288.1 hypothetical protein [Pseudomonas gingeri]